MSQSERLLSPMAFLGSAFTFNNELCEGGYKKDEGVIDSPKVPKVRTREFQSSHREGKDRRAEVNQKRTSEGGQKMFNLAIPFFLFIMSVWVSYATAGEAMSSTMLERFFCVTNGSQYPATDSLLASEKFTHDSIRNRTNMTVATNADPWCHGPAPPDTDGSTEGDASGRHVCMSGVDFEILNNSVSELSEREIYEVLSQIREELGQCLQACDASRAQVRLLLGDGGYVVKEKIENSDGSRRRAIAHMGKINRLVKRLRFPCDQRGEILLSVKFHGLKDISGGNIRQCRSEPDIGEF